MLVINNSLKNCEFLIFFQYFFNNEDPVDLTVGTYFVFKYVRGDPEVMSLFILFLFNY